MNREKRRGLQKRLRDKDFRARTADFFENLGDGINDFILDGDLVTLRVDQIMGRREYPRLQARYRRFVEASRGKVFVAHSYRARPDGFSAVMELEDVEWMFWCGDLERVKGAGDKGAG